MTTRRAIEQPRDDPARRRRRGAVPPRRERRAADATAAMSWRRLRTLLRREVRATLRDPFTVTILIAVPLVALLAFGFTLSTEVAAPARSACSTPAARAASRRLSPSSPRNGTFAPRAYATRERLERALVARRRSASPSSSRPTSTARSRDAAPRRAARRGPGALRRRRDRARRQRRGLPARHRRGDRRALARRRGARRRAPAAPRATAASRSSTRALFNPTLDGTPFMVAGHLRLRALVPHDAHHRGLDRERAAHGHLRAAPGHARDVARDPARQDPAARRRVRVRRRADDARRRARARRLAARAARSSSSRVSSFYVLISLSLGLIFSATSATAAEAVQKTVLFSIPLMQPRRLRLPDPQHADRASSGSPSSSRRRTTSASAAPSTCAARARSTLAARARAARALRRRCSMALALRTVGGARMKRPRASGRTCSRSPTRRRASCATTAPFLGVVARAADHDAAPLRLRALEQARERAVGGARPQRRRARRAASSQEIAGDAATSSPPQRGRELRRRARRLLRARRRARAPRHPRRLRARRRARAAARCSCCSTAPIRSRRRASAAYVAQVAARVRRRAARAGAAPDAAPATRRPRSTLRQRFWFNADARRPRLLPAALAGMLLTNLCLSATSLGARRRARERHLRADAVAADERRSRSCSASSLPYVGALLRRRC